MGDRVGEHLGNYRLVRMIGQGSFADVYLGEHIHLFTQAAIKVLQLRLVGSSTEQFRTEARTIAGLIHPNIVRVLDFGLADGLPFLVMDYAPGGTLRQRHPRSMPLPSATVVTYVRQIAAALQYAHDRKLIHRDVKPENLLVGREQEVFLSDFGLVLIAQSSGSRSLQEMSGTVAYMAPEQLQGRPRQASDQYSLGIIVYEWLSGNRPFNGTFTELASQHLLVPPPPLYGRIPGVSAAVEEVVQTALEQAYQNPAQQSLMPSELASTFSGSTYVEQSLEPPVQQALHVSSHDQHMEPGAFPGEGMAPAAERPTAMVSSGERITSPWDKAIPPRTRPPAQREERQRPTAGRLVLLTMLALLMIAGGLGWFYFVNASAKSRADATLTAHAQAQATARAAADAYANWVSSHGVMFGFDAAHTHWNRLEQVISSRNVAHLHPLWSYATGDSVLSSPTVANGIAYVGSLDGKLYAFDATCRSDCQPLWSYTTGYRIASSPTVANGVVYIGSGDHKLYAFGLPGASS